MATPPPVKLRPEQSAQLRFIYSGTGLPADRESLFWVNIQEVPPAPEENNILQFAIRTRLKLFYRPQGIATSLPKAVENLQWQQSANTLSFTNNSPLHITVINAEAIDNKGKIYPLKNFMLLPYSHHAVNIASMQRLHKMKYINDYGAVVDIPIKNKRRTSLGDRVMDDSKLRYFASAWLISITLPADSAERYNAQFVNGIDPLAFNQFVASDGDVMPGTYDVNIYINDLLVDSRPVRFSEDSAHGGLAPA